MGILDRYFNDVDFFTEFERFDRHLELLRRKDEGGKIDYVSVCSPNYLHDAHIRFVLRAGAHPICEKPLDVIALVGGETADSDMSEIYVQRKDREFIFDAEELIEGQGNQQEEDFYLKSGDRVFVSRKWGASSNTAILISATGLLVAVIALFLR